MLEKLLHNTIKTAAIILSAALAASCGIFDKEEDMSHKNVFIYMGLGYNNLSPYINSDIAELTSNYIPATRKDNDVLLIFSHLTSKYYDYTIPTSPTLTRVSKDRKGNIIKDTLLVMPSGTIATSATAIRDVLEFAKEMFPESQFGMLMSSHGTGWAPADYCTHPEKYDDVDNEDTDTGIWQSRRLYDVIPKPFLEDLSVDGAPAVKGIGVHSNSKTEIIEMDITDLAKAFPMKMEYIIFDACFMGGIEVAYELRDVCRRIIFSQTEILAEGMDYRNMAMYLLGGSSPDLEGFCKNYFDFYNNNNGQYQSATISLVDCTRLNDIANVCKDIFETNREGIASLEGGSLVQKYYRNSHSTYHKWFFDLKDIVVKSGATEDEVLALQEALDECIIYKAATERFLNSIDIQTHCGLSMYLPYQDRTYLNNFYKTLKWNKATGLVQ